MPMLLPVTTCKDLQWCKMEGSCFFSKDLPLPIHGDELANTHRKHLSEDISPYMCVLPGCSQPHQLYKDRKEWMDHMQNEHTSSRYWLCFACPEPSKFDEEIFFVGHLQAQHNTHVRLRVLFLGAIEHSWMPALSARTYRDP
ncbi:hypothetical protein D0Z07_5177 [Hyphodiscus hymeniophilus]|uniref:Uncharacterized protein n=1 Tax=Hyphodiscus hymeniophilus TaxID=353542 RepID=A0A9P7AWE3_9HELO|nr:hypothetical protein D0Z07_5177 [Hyphodiscus hymeniophilus]